MTSFRKEIALETLSVDALKTITTKIHFFGLGFIQVKLGETSRLHFYASELPPFVESPHNHRYDFVSKVLSGTFRNIIYTEHDDGDMYVMTKESCKEGVGPTEDERRIVALAPAFDRVYTAGESYFMDHNTLHTVFGTEAITHLTRSNIRKEMADVTRLIGTDPVCPFAKKIAEKTLWEIVDAMLANAKKKAEFA